MSISLADIIFLQSPRGQTLLSELEQQDLSPKSILALVTRLRKNYPQNEVNAAISMAELRRKAVTKFGEDANTLFFTDDGLQQASDPYIRLYRTQNSAGLRVLDVCCGIGTDSIAFAKAGAVVHGIDYDEARIAIAQYNASILDLDIQFTIADVTLFTDMQDYDLLFFDPARRDAQGKRLYDVEQYLPPLSLIDDWQAGQVMVKISPGVDLRQLERYRGTVEFISTKGDLKEAVLHRSQSSALIATKIEKSDIQRWENRGEVVSVPIDVPSGYLCEPDPSILRAKLVEHLTESLNGHMLDKTIAYFCTDELPESTWIRAWKIREWLPFNLKKLRVRLRAMDVGTVTVKKRGSPITPEELIRKLKLKGTQSATVVLTRYDEQAIAIICDDILPV